MATDPIGTSSGATIPKLNMSTIPQAEVPTSSAPDVKEPSLSIIGYKLSVWVLGIIIGFLAVFFIYLFVHNFDASDKMQVSMSTGQTIADSTLTQQITLFKAVQEEKKNCRDFTLQIAQMVLLNLLLPVLTAILGYIFASNSKPKEQS